MYTDRQTGVLYESLNGNVSARTRRLRTFPVATCRRGGRDLDQRGVKAYATMLHAISTPTCMDTHTGLSVHRYICIS